MYLLDIYFDPGGKKVWHLGFEDFQTHGLVGFCALGFGETTWEVPTKIHIRPSLIHLGLLRIERNTTSTETAGFIGGRFGKKNPWMDSNC